jgi:hypothetical protein
VTGLNLERMKPIVAMLLAGTVTVSAMGCSGGAATGTSPPVERTETLCDRTLLSIADVSGILRESIVAALPVPGDVQSCEFDTAGFPAIIASMRPGRGHSELRAWGTGKLPLTVDPVPGVGESAVWQHSLQKLISQQDDLLCEIQLRGQGTDIAGAAAALAPKLGALCNHLFSAY